MSFDDIYDKYRAALIKAVHENHLLWDKKNKFNNQKALKQQVWKELAEKFGKANDVQKNWANLLHQYRYNLKREIVYGIKPQWKFYNDMSFLRESNIVKNNNKASSDSESDVETKTYLKQKQKQDFLKNLQTAVSNSDKDFQKIDVDEVQLCNAAEQEEADSCSIEEWIKTEIDLEEEMEAKNVTFDNDTRSTTQGLEEMISVTPHQIMILSNSNNNNMIHIPPTNSTPMPRKRCRVENEECDEIEKINAGSQISIRNASELLAVHATEGVECDTNMDNRESQTRKNRWAKEIYIHESPEDDLTNLHEISEDTTTDDCGLQKRYIAQTHTCVDKQVRDRKECQIDSVDTSTKYLKKKKNKKIKAKRDMQQKDDDYHFVISLLPYLRRGNLERKLQTRMDLMKVVMEGLKCNDE
ncbi:PREDICTED: uncharacterized protein LOC108366875 isoform X3 [Rhagoletis zephyria]|uniref:uncharacterized protein LOC108366875 isoform X3 n=1 Tax=Rhagoletis zephyria TaxID=28612 RepID=UPI0008118F34|nr:PREDICTED: uncharacterized protein LOC108366875 isoform X3 [Rhagoletis zephyria]